MADDIYTKSPTENAPIEAAAEDLYARQPFYADLKKGEYKDCTRNLSRLLVAIETAAYAGLEEARCHLTFELVLRYSRQLSALLASKSDLIAVEHSLRLYGFYDEPVWDTDNYCEGPAYKSCPSSLEALCSYWKGWIRNDTAFQYIRQRIPVEKWPDGSLRAFLRYRPLAEFEKIYHIVESRLTDSNEWISFDSRLMETAIEDFIRTGTLDKVKFLVSKNIKFRYFHVVKILNDGLIPLLEFMHESKIDIMDTGASRPSLDTLKWLHEHKYDITYRIAIPCTDVPLHPGLEENLKYGLEQKLPIHQQIWFTTIQNDNIMLILLQDRIRIKRGIPSIAIRHIRSNPFRFPKSLKFAHDQACLPDDPDIGWDWPIPHYAGVHKWCLN